MDKEEIKQLENMLIKLQSLQTCKGKYCIFHQSCEYGMSGSYGDMCAIDYVLDVIKHDENLKSR